MLLAASVIPIRPPVLVKVFFIPVAEGLLLKKQLTAALTESSV